MCASRLNVAWVWLGYGLGVVWVWLGYSLGGVRLGGWRPERSGGGEAQVRRAIAPCSSHPFREPAGWEVGREAAPVVIPGLPWLPLGGGAPGEVLSEAREGEGDRRWPLWKSRPEPHGRQLRSRVAKMRPPPGRLARVGGRTLAGCPRRPPHGDRG